MKVKVQLELWKDNMKDRTGKAAVKKRPRITWALCSGETQPSDKGHRRGQGT